MRLGWWKVSFVAFAVVALGAHSATAGPRKGRAEAPAAVPRVPGIMVDVDEHGVPIIMQGQGTRSKSSVRVGRASKRAGFPREIPRGSSAYVPPIPLPSSSGRGAGLIAPPSVTPYTPPPISNPSERIGQFNQSFPLNGGLGNNPTDRDAYIRYNFNR